MSVYVHVTGVPRNMALSDLAHHMDNLFGDDDIGSFRVREITEDHGDRHRQLAIYFESPFHAMVAQDKLDRFQFLTTPGDVYCLRAKVRRVEFNDSNPWVDSVNSSLSQFDTDFDKQLELLRKQRLILQAERKVLVERTKLIKKYAQLAKLRNNSDSLDEIRDSARSESGKMKKSKKKSRKRSRSRRRSSSIEELSTSKKKYQNYLDVAICIKELDIKIKSSPKLKSENENCSSNKKSSGSNCSERNVSASTSNSNSSDNYKDEYSSRNRSPIKGRYSSRSRSRERHRVVIEELDDDYKPKFKTEPENSRKFGGSKIVAIKKNEWKLPSKSIKSNRSDDYKDNRSHRNGSPIKSRSRSRERHRVVIEELDDDYKPKLKTEPESSRKFGGSKIVAIKKNECKSPSKSIKSNRIDDYKDNRSHRNRSPIKRLRSRSQERICSYSHHLSKYSPYTHSRRSRSKERYRLKRDRDKDCHYQEERQLLPYSRNNLTESSNKKSLNYKSEVITVDRSNKLNPSFDLEPVQSETKENLLKKETLNPIRLKKVVGKIHDELQLVIQRFFIIKYQIEAETVKQYLIKQIEKNVIKLFPKKFFDVAPIDTLVKIYRIEHTPDKDKDFIKECFDLLLVDYTSINSNMYICNPETDINEFDIEKLKKTNKDDFDISIESKECMSSAKINEVKKLLVSQIKNAHDLQDYKIYGRPLRDDELDKIFGILDDAISKRLQNLSSVAKTSVNEILDNYRQLYKIEGDSELLNGAVLEVADSKAIDIDDNSIWKEVDELFEDLNKDEILLEGLR